MINGVNGNTVNNSSVSNNQAINRAESNNTKSGKTDSSAKAWIQEVLQQQESPDEALPGNKSTSAPENPPANNGHASTRDFLKDNLNKSNPAAQPIRVSANYNMVGRYEQNLSVHGGNAVNPDRDEKPTDDVIKHTVGEAMIQRIEALPSREELAKTYPRSETLDARVANIINMMEVNGN